MKNSRKKARFPQLYRSSPNLLVINTDLAATSTTKATGLSLEMAEEILSSLERLRFYRCIVDLGALSMATWPVLLQELSGHCQDLSLRLDVKTLLDHWSDLEESLSNYCPGLILNCGLFNFDQVQAKLPEICQALNIINELGYGSELSVILQFDCEELEITGQKNKCLTWLRQKMLDSGALFSDIDLRVQSPIKKVQEALIEQGQYDERMKLLSRSFRADMIDSLPCLHSIEVNNRGEVFDCEYNLQLERHPFRHSKKIWQTKAREWIQREIAIGKHCFACTANCRPLDD